MDPPYFGYRIAYDGVLQEHLRAVALPDRFVMHSVPAVCSIEQVAGRHGDRRDTEGREGWRGGTENVATYCIGSSTSTRVETPKRQRGNDWAIVIGASLQIYISSYAPLMYIMFG